MLPAGDICVICSGITVLRPFHIWHVLPPTGLSPKRQTTEGGGLPLGLCPGSSKQLIGLTGQVVLNVVVQAKGDAARILASWRTGAAMHVVKTETVGQVKRASKKGSKERIRNGTRAASASLISSDCGQHARGGALFPTGARARVRGWRPTQWFWPARTALLAGTAD